MYIQYMVYDRHWCSYGDEVWLSKARNFSPLVTLRSESTTKTFHCSLRFTGQRGKRPLISFPKIHWSKCHVLNHWLHSPKIGNRTFVAFLFSGTRKSQSYAYIDFTRRRVIRWQLHLWVFYSITYRLHHWKIHTDVEKYIWMSSNLGLTTRSPAHLKIDFIQNITCQKAFPKKCYKLMNLAFREAIFK